MKSSLLVWMILSPVNGFVLPSATTTNKPLRFVGSTPQPLSPSSFQQRGRCTDNNRMLQHSSTTALQMLHNPLQTVQAMLHKDPSFVLSAVLLLSIFGISLEKRTTVGKALSAPLATMALALTVANLGIIPFVSPVYAMVNRYLIPLAVPMLLFDSDLRRVLSDTGSLLACFLVGAFATVCGTLVAYPLLPLTALGPNVGWRVACALAARHIGGAINFVAVAETLQVSGTAVSAAIAADNVVVAIYFAFLFFISKPGNDDDNEPQNAKSSSEDVTDPEDVTTQRGDISLSSLGLAISVSSCLETVGRLLAGWLFPGVSSLPVTSTLTVFAATLFPKFFATIRSAGTAVGILFIQMFFASSGAAGSIKMVLQSAPSLFAFSMVQIGVHFGVLMTLGRGILRLPSRELYLASNANVGGPTTAAAMAQAKEWKRLVMPALLVGIFGYATATGIALALGPILQRMPLIGK